MQNMASRAAMRGASRGPKAIRPEDKHESELNEEDRHQLSGDIDCIVIGCGLSGLTAARDLVVQGYKVVMFESSHRVGGRCFSTMFPDTTTYVDLGGEWFDTEKHELMTNEAKRYNLNILPENAVICTLTLQRI